PEGTARRVLRGGGRLRRLPDLRPLRPARRGTDRGAGDRRGVRLDHRAAPGLRHPGRRPGKSDHRKERRLSQPYGIVQPEVGPYGITVSKDVMVTMRDGIRLALDLYRPARDGELVPGRWPTIVCITPYDKGERRYTEIADFFVPHGYAVVLQD